MAGGHADILGTLDTDYQTSINYRRKASSTGAFRFGATTPTHHDDFAPSLSSINSYEQGSSTGGYVVRGGETLASIAADLWGDPSLWYKLAEANGLSAQSALSEGQRLAIPAGVMKSTHNASTFKPYDPSETIGDTSPTTRKPPKKAKNCGMLGAVLLAVVAVAVTIATSGAFLAATGAVSGGFSAGVAATLGIGGAAGVAGSVGAGALIAAGAVGGAVGSVVSQGVGIVTGLQDKFSWKGVALGALGGAIGGATGVGGLTGKAGAFSGVNSAFAQGALRGALSSGLSQGIGVATGLQSKFDWAGVAAASVGGGVGSSIGRKLNIGTSLSVANASKTLVSSMAGNIANAAARTLITGTDFGDNIIAALPDVISSTVGGIIGSAAADANYSAGLTDLDGSLNERLAGASTPPASSLGEKLFHAVSELESAGQNLPTGALAAATDSKRYLVPLADPVQLASADARGVAGFLAGVTNSTEAAEALADYRVAMLRRGRVESDLANLVEIRALRYELMIKEGINLGRELRRVQSIAQKITDISAVDGSIREAAFWVTIAEDGPGPRPTISWGDALRPKDAFVGQVKYEGLRSVHKAYQAGLRSYVTANAASVLRAHKGAPPAWMKSAHAHHAVFFKGQGPEQQALAIEGQMVLRSVGIDPYLGPENLYWAPNVAGQHTSATLRPLVQDLRGAYEAGANRLQILNILRDHGQAAARRGR